MSRLLRLIPCGRIGDPRDVASAVPFLASNPSDDLTGATVFVDGGMGLYPSLRGAG